MSTFNVYGVKDLVDNSFFCVSSAVTDGSFIRQNFLNLLRLKPRRDMQVFCLGTYDTLTGVIIPSSPRLVDWDAYKFPETASSPIGQDTTPEKIVEAFNKKVLENKK